MSTVDNGSSSVSSFGVRPISEREGQTVNPFTGLPYNDDLYSKQVRPLNISIPINPDTGTPYTEQEIDQMPIPAKMPAIDFSSPSVQVSIVQPDGSIHTHTAPTSGELRYSVQRNKAYAEENNEAKLEERVQAYRIRERQHVKDVRAYKAARALWVERDGVHPPTKQHPNGYQYDCPKRPSKPVDPRTRAPKVTEQTISVPFNGIDSIAYLMEHYNCTDEQVDAVAVEYERRMKDAQAFNARPYTVHWSELSPTGQGFTKYGCTLPDECFRAMLESLCVCTVHGEFVYNNAGECISVQYTKGQESYLEFCSFVHRMYVHRKIDAIESNAQGFGGKTRTPAKREQTYTIQVSNGRGKTNGLRTGRLYSMSDREDIINRTFLMAFTPDTCTLFPVTDDGRGYIQCPSVQVESEEYVRETTTIHPYSGKEYKNRYPGYLVTFTCTSGQLYQTFTNSLNRVEEMTACTGIAGIVDSKLEKGDFGDCTAVKLRSNSVRQYNAAYPYSGIIKYVATHYFQWLFKRTSHKCTLVWQHDRDRSNHGMENSIPLYTILENNEGMFSNVELDIIAVELMTPEELAQAYSSVRPDERRATAFRDIRVSNGEQTHTDTGSRVYYKMVVQLYTKMRAMYEPMTEDLTYVQAATIEMLNSRIPEEPTVRPINK